MTQIQVKDIPTVLRMLADAIQYGKTEATFALVEEWYNCPCIEGETKLSIVYQQKKKPLGERQC